MKDEAGYVYVSYVFFFNDTATTEIYTLSLHDALPICARHRAWRLRAGLQSRRTAVCGRHLGLADAVQHRDGHRPCRSEEHTSELQSRQYLVCRLLLEKKKTNRLPLLATPKCVPIATAN